MAPIIDQKALEDFIDHADLDDARRAEAALTAMAASVRLLVVELETRIVEGGGWSDSSSRRPLGEASWGKQ